MKKTIVLLLLSILFTSFSVQAQTEEKTIDAETFGDLMCDCINQFMDDMHPEIKRMMRNMEVIGEEEAQERFVTYIEEHPEETAKILSDGEKLQKFEQSMSKLPGCQTLIEISKDKSFKEDKDLEKEIEDYLENKSKCVYAFIFYQIGSEKK